MRTSDASRIAMLHFRIFSPITAHCRLLGGGVFFLAPQSDIEARDGNRKENAVSKSKGLDVMPTERITQSILVLRGHRVLLDADLAELYGVTTKRFNEQVRRNRERFPEDFIFRLTDEEAAILRSQIATSSSSLWGGRRYLPYAFTEHGAIMAATILNSDRAVQVSVHVVRAFVKLREVLASNKELARKLEQFERKLDSHDQAIVGVLKTIHDLRSEARTRAIDITAALERMP
jgi:hypothetical protein